MKKIAILALATLGITVSVFSQDKKTPAEVIKFEQETHSFGKIPQGKPVTYDFVFTNVSKEPIVIEKAQASCGCTTPKWPTEAIMPGKSAAINVGYNAASVAPFDKTISVKIAGVENMAMLRINGEVIGGDAKPADAPKTAEPAAAQKVEEAKAEPLKKEEAKAVTPATKTAKKAAKPKAKPATPATETKKS